MIRFHRSVRAIAWSVLLLALAEGQVSAQAPPAAAPTIELASPPDGSYATGITTLLAHVEPASAVSTVTFFVDGRQVCAISRPPFSCDWNAGTAVEEHQIRLVANLVGGGRTVRNVSTKALDFVYSVDVDVVQVTAVVTRGGRFVKGLPQTAFRIYEDDKLQPIAHFENEDVPLELVVAVDISTSMTLAMPKLKEALREFLGAMAPTDKVTLLGFNDSIYTLTRRETSPAERIKAVDGLNASGATALYDVMIRGLDLLDQQTGRKALVVFTDGEDQGSGTPLQDVVDRLKASAVTLFMIGQGKSLELPALRKGMQNLATPTGGRALFTEKPEELREAFTELRIELANQYLIGFVPTDGKQDDSWHRIKVEVDRGDVRARDGYRRSLKK